MSEINNQNLKVSIITVVYNGAKTIERTIQSVLQQSYKNIEYIIVDGLSTDGTQTIIGKYRNYIDLFISEKDNGLYDAMNKGIEKAVGDIIGIINSDDWYTKDAVKNVVEYFEKNRVGLVYGNVINIYNNGSQRLIGKKPIVNIWYENVIHHPSVFVKKNIYEIFGTFNTRYKISSDYEFFLRLYSQHVKFGYIDKVIAYFRIGGITTIKHEQMEDETYFISIAYINNCPNKREVLCKINEERTRICFEREICIGKKTLIELLCKYFRENIKDLIVFGTGIWGERCYKVLQSMEVKVSYFVDNDTQKWNTEFHGIKIINPAELQNIKANLLIAVKKNGTEIKQQLEKMKNNELKHVSLEELQILFSEQISYKRNMVEEYE